MPEEKKPHYRNLREAIISANLQTGSTLKNQWVYKDESDLEVFHVLDYVNEDDHRRQSRTVWRVSPAEDGWRMDEPPRPWPLYRLPDIPQFQRVYICQNEADAEAACKMGLVATTSAHGCYAVDKTEWTPLAGRDVVLLPQRNEAGWVFVRKVSREMDRLLPPGEVRVVELPGLPLNGGVADFLDMQLSRDPQLAGQEIDALADETPEFWTLRWSEARHGRLAAGQQRRFGGAEPATAQLADVKPQEMQWLWPGRVPVGKLSMLFAGADSDPLGLDLAARVSAGLAWPDGSGRPRAARCCCSTAMADSPTPSARIWTGPARTSPASWRWTRGAWRPADASPRFRHWTRSSSGPAARAARGRRPDGAHRPGFGLPVRQRLSLPVRPGEARRRTQGGRGDGLAAGPQAERAGPAAGAGRPRPGRVAVGLAGRHRHPRRRPPAPPEREGRSGQSDSGLGIPSHPGAVDLEPRRPACAPTTSCSPGRAAGSPARPPPRRWPPSNGSATGS